MNPNATAQTPFEGPVKQMNTDQIAAEAAKQLMLELGRQRRRSSVSAALNTRVSEPLLPCPFCGSKAIMHDKGQFWVSCSYVGVCPVSLYDSRIHGCTYKEDAIRIWNRRQSLTEPNRFMNTDQIAAEAANKIEAAFHCDARDTRRFIAIIKAAIEKAHQDGWHEGRAYEQQFGARAKLK